VQKLAGTGRTEINTVIPFLMFSLKKTHITPISDTNLNYYRAEKASGTYFMMKKTALICCLFLFSSTEKVANHAKNN
jgi:hypothetical protein